MYGVSVWRLDDNTLIFTGFRRSRLGALAVSPHLGLTPELSTTGGPPLQVGDHPYDPSCSRPYLRVRPRTSRRATRG